MTDLFTLSGKVDVDLTQLKQQVDQTQRTLAPLQKGMKQFEQSTAGVTKAAAQSAQSVARVGQAATQARQPVQSLTQSTQQLTTGILGTNVATIALGAAFGSVLTGAVVGMVRAIGEAVAQFTLLQNELAAIDNVAGGAAAAFVQIQAVARTSNTSLRDLTQGYGNLARSVQGTRVTVEEATAIFIKHANALTQIQERTLSASLQNVGTAFGNVVVNVDRALGVSSLLIAGFDKLAELLEGIANLLPRQPRTVEEWRAKQQQLNAELAIAVREHRQYASLLQDANDTTATQLRLR
jgi:hypothetical protein